MKEYQLTLVYRAEDEEDATQIAEMIENVLQQLDHPRDLGGPGSAQSAP